MPNTVLADVQGSTDARGLALDCAGITDLRLPATITDADGVTHATIISASAWAAVPANVRGTHMSRLAEALGTWRAGLELAALPTWLDELATTMGETNIGVSLEFPLFLTRPTPVSRRDSWIDFTACVTGRRDVTGCCLTATVTVPVKLLCPCSKEISTDGAHTQRAHLRATVRPCNALPSLCALAMRVEAHASAPLQAVLKRDDEKVVTEGAYAKPRFVEDAAREIAQELAADATIAAWAVRVLNFESIHNHQAFAEISSTPAP